MVVIKSGQSDEMLLLAMVTTTPEWLAVDVNAGIDEKGCRTRYERLGDAP